MAFDTQGNLVVAMVHGHRVDTFTKEGDLVRSVGKRGGGPLEFLGPMSVEANHRLHDAILAQQLWTTTNLTPAEIATLTAPRIDPPSPLPAVTRAEQRFPYVYRPRLAIEAYRRWGGYGGVARLLSEPPAATPEVPHPDKYL